MITSLIEMLLLPNFGYKTTSQAYDARAIKKKEAWAGDEKPNCKAAWADIARAKFSIARPELVLIELI